MQFTQANYNGNAQEIFIHPSGDWHSGHVNYLEQIVQDWLDKLNYENRGLLMGDLMEVATKTSVGKGLFDTNMTPQRQKEYIIELLRPKAEYIDGGVIGNHEERVINDTSLNLLKDVCDALNIPYLGYQGIVKYAWNDRAYLINMWHGKTAGSSISSAMKEIEDMAIRTYSDVYLMGHVHKKATSDRIFAFPNARTNTIQNIQQHFVTTGSALAYEEGYGEMKGLTPRCLGFPSISLGGKRDGKQKIKEIHVIK